MKKFIKSVKSLVFLAIFVSSSVFALMPMNSSKINAQAEASYKATLAKSKVLNNNDAKMVKRIGERIARAVDTYYIANSSETKPKEGFDWEFNLIKDDNTANAWCMPGGKVAVYTGILKYTKNEEGLAVVMSHEIAHAVLEHGKKQYNTGVLRNIGSVIVGVAVGSDAQDVYDIGTGLGTLKYSRTHETAADKLGLVLMRLSGYDPNVAITFWEGMSSGKDSSGLQLLSTHPSDATRIKNIKKYLSSKEYRRKAGIE